MKQAQTAAALYDQFGVLTMEKYIRHCRPAPYSDALWTGPTRTIIMPDQSVVKMDYTTNGQEVLEFCWLDAQGQPVTETRTVAKWYSRTALKPEMNSIAALPWPNTESVQTALLELAQRDAGIDDEPHFMTEDLAVMDTLAPDARSAVNESIRQDQAPNFILDQLAELEREYAVDAKALIPASQWQALLEYLRSRTDE